MRAVRIDLAMRALVEAENLEPTQEEIDEELETHRRGDERRRGRVARRTFATLAAS